MSTVFDVERMQEKQKKVKTLFTRNEKKFSRLCKRNEWCFASVAGNVFVKLGI